MQNGDEALPSISPAGIGQFVKMLITFIRFFILIHFNIDTDMLIGDEVSPSISLAGVYHFVKMLM